MVVCFAAKLFFRQYDNAYKYYGCIFRVNEMVCLPSKHTCSVVTSLTRKYL